MGIQGEKLNMDITFTSLNVYFRLRYSHHDLLKNPIFSGRIFLSNLLVNSFHDLG